LTFNDLTGVDISEPPPALRFCKLGSNQFNCPIPEWTKSMCGAYCS